MKEQSDKQEEHDHALWISGYRVASVGILTKILGNLGYSDPVAAKTKWILEREKLVITLRRLCEKWGDIDWDSQDCDLANVLEKHLENYLKDRLPDTRADL